MRGYGICALKSLIIVVHVLLLLGIFSYLPGFIRTYTYIFSETNLPAVFFRIHIQFIKLEKTLSTNMACIQSLLIHTRKKFPPTRLSEHQDY